MISSFCFYIRQKHIVYNILLCYNGHSVVINAVTNLEDNMQKRYDYCPNCMQATEENVNICRGCGFDIEKYEEKEHLIAPCTMLKDKYMIGKVIGEGGFGVTYKGWDTILQTYVAIKEYFPQFLSHRSKHNTDIIPTTTQKETYEKGLKRYLEEAQNLSKFYQLSGIVSVKDFFYENGTGYIVMEYIDGVNLKEYLDQNGGKIPEVKVRGLMKPVLESLVEIHETGLIHRDISPDNVMVDKKGRIKLIDFGSVRDQSTVDEKTYTVTLKHGFAPPEQYYAKGKQGPWTDIYSICATMYRMLTGKNPPNSIERMAKDEYVSPAYYGVNVSPKLDYVLRKGLSLNYADRYDNIQQLIDDLYNGEKARGNVPIGMAQNPVQQPMMQASANRQMPNHYSPVQQNIAVGNAMVQHNVPYRAANTPYQANVGYTQQQAMPNKTSKSWKKIITKILLAAVIIFIGIPFIIGVIIGITEDKDTTQKNTSEAITTEDTSGMITDKSEKYSGHGITISFPESYYYDTSVSDEDCDAYSDDNKGIFLVFSGYTEGISEDEFVGNIESYMEDVFVKGEWTSYNTNYAGTECTEFSGKIEDSGMKYDAIASFVYFKDAYIVVIYMPIYGDMSDYYTAMESIKYDN